MREILGYTLDKNQCVSDLGKFEGEPAYTPYLWETCMDGDSDATFDCDAIYYSCYLVNDDLRAMFPLLLGSEDYAVCLWESNEGFVNSECFTKSQYDNFVADCVSSQPDEEE